MIGLFESQTWNSVLFWADTERFVVIDSNLMLETLQSLLFWNFEFLSKEKKIIYSFEVVHIKKIKRIPIISL